MPLVYVAITIAGTVWLLWRYATNPPAASEALSINLGWGGLGSMVLMLVYSVARRSRKLRNIARLSYWLHFHIWLGVMGMIMVLFHSYPIFVRESPLMLLNPGFLNLLAVGVVFFSGLFGRYLYSMLPRRIGGEQMMVREVEEELARLPDDLPEEVSALWSGTAPARSLRQQVAVRRQARVALKRLRAMNLPEEQHALAHRRLTLERRKIGLRVAQRIFHNWIILHRPIAALMYVLSFVHVMLAYMFTPSLGG